MNVQELATVARYRLPVKIVLLDNQALGMVRQWQELFFERRYSEIDLSDNPDFCALAQAFGVKTLKLDQAAKVEETLQALLAIEGPALLHVAIDQAANVWPLVPPNRNNTEMMDADEATTLDRIVMPASPATASASPAPAAPAASAASTAPTAALSLPSSSQEPSPCATDSI
jgi:acetolactate synthase-1/2/3 large subunit